MMDGRQQPKDLASRYPLGMDVFTVEVDLGGWSKASAEYWKTLTGGGRDADELPAA